MELKESIKILKDRIKRNKDCMKAISSQKDNFEEDDDYIYFKKIVKQ